MALTRDRVIDKIEVLEDGTLQIREATYIQEDGVRIGLLGYHRTVFSPGSNVDAATERVKAIAGAVWEKAVEPLARKRGRA